MVFSPQFFKGANVKYIYRARLNTQVIEDGTTPSDTDARSFDDAMGGGRRGGERAPLLPERGYGGEATTSDGRVSYGDEDRSFRRGRMLMTVETLRDGLTTTSTALNAMRTKVMTMRDEEEVCARRTTRVRRVTLAATGVLALCCAAASSASGSSRNGAAIGGRRPALGEDSVDAALDNLFETNRISELKLEYGDKVRVRPVDPSRTGGKAKKWAEEYKDVIEAKESYDPDFGREGHIFDRHASDLDTEIFSANEPIGHHDAAGGASAAALQGGDEFDALSTGLSDSVEIDDSLVVGLGSKEHDIDMGDLMVDADSVSEHIKKRKTEKSSDGGGSSKKERSNGKKASTADENDHEDDDHLSKRAKSTTRDKRHQSKQKHTKIQEKQSTASRADAIKDMSFDEIGLKTSKKSLMQQIKDLKERLKHPKSAKSRRGRLSQYPHHSKDEDENDENDSEVFYKKSDLLDLGEYNQATIDDFKYGRGLEPRHSGAIHSLTVDDVDVSNYPSSGGGSVHYPSRTASAGDIENDPDALQSLMSSLHVTAKKANSHTKLRKKQQKVEHAVDERREKREDAKVAKKAGSLDWGSRGGSKRADALDWSGASTKESGASAKGTLDWSDEASSSEPHKLSVKSAKKNSVKTKSAKTAKHVESSKQKHEFPSSSSQSKPKGERSTKIGRMSKETAAKYLSKVKGHNEETHKSLKRVNPKLGATKKSSVPVDDDLYEDAPSTSEVRLPKEHNERHKTVAEVVEAAAQEQETSNEAALGRKRSAVHHLKHATQAEVQRGGAWRRIFSTIFRGKEYSAAREHIFSNSNE